MLKEWVWYGFAGHFICGPWCRFHLFTDLRNGYVVSSVGDFHSASQIVKSGESTVAEEIGCGRKYETMVFRAGKKCRVKECGCGMPTLKTPRELDSRSYMTAGEATKGHYALCKKWAMIEPQVGSRKVRRKGR